MKKFVRFFLVIVGVIVILIIIALVYVHSFLPDVGDPPEIHADLSETNIQRGDYLANHVMVCIDCHSLRDWTTFAGPPVAGTEGAGGELFNREFGFPGEFYSPNITPYGVGEWTDGELFRAITSGVTKDNKSIFPIMPYLLYGTLDEADITAVIAFVRTLQEKEASYPEPEMDFPFNFILNTIPKKAALTTRPHPDEAIEYGNYMITAAACQDCHTKADQGKVVGEYLAGGFEFQFPDGNVVRSSNITPDNTGIGRWNREFFINRFKLYTDTTYVNPPVKPGEFQTVMPWHMYAGMSEQDLGAIYDYLQTVAAVENVVERITFANN